MKYAQTLSLLACSTIFVSCYAPVGPVIDQDATKHPTFISVQYLDGQEPDPKWKRRVEENAAKAEEILSSTEFAEAYRKEKIRGTKGKTVNEVINELQYSGETEINVGFYNNPDTRAIAYEEGGNIYFNTAKDEAGSPGNIAHELTHKMGYKHFTNWAFLGRRSVPYTVGYAVDDLAE